MTPAHARCCRSHRIVYGVTITVYSDSAVYQCTAIVCAVATVMRAPVLGQRSLPLRERCSKLHGMERSR
jgi:hypothetical protein